MGRNTHINTYPLNETWGETLISIHTAPLNETWGENTHINTYSTPLMRHGEKHSYQYIQHPLNETWGETLISIHTPLMRHGEKTLISIHTAPP